MAHYITKSHRRSVNNDKYLYTKRKVKQILDTLAQLLTHIQANLIIVNIDAGVAQLVERLLPKQGVTGSSPVTRS